MSAELGDDERPLHTRPPLPDEETLDRQFAEMLEALDKGLPDMGIDSIPIMRKMVRLHRRAAGAIEKAIQEIVKR